jgi:hypothetical protein
MIRRSIRIPKSLKLGLFHSDLFFIVFKDFYFSTFQWEDFWQFVARALRVKNTFSAQTPTGVNDLSNTIPATGAAPRRILRPKSHPLL